MRTEHHNTNNPAQVRVSNPGGDTIMHASTEVTNAYAVLTPTTVSDETAADRINRAEVTSTKSTPAVPRTKDNLSGR